MADEAGTGADAPAGTTDAGADTSAANPQNTLQDSYSEGADQNNGAEDNDAANKDSPDTDQNADQGKGDDDSDDASDDSSKADEADDKSDEGSDPDKKDDDQDGDKDDDDAKAASYEEFTLPEGYQLDTKLSEKALPILAKYNVPQEEVQTIVDEIVAGQSEFAKQASDNHTALVEGWGKDTKEQFGKDGDAAFEEKSANAKMAMEKFFTPDQMRHIDAWGVGNMSGLFGLAEVVGSAMKEDGSFASNAGGSNKDETVADIWYPNS